jgi:hypothetical protein
MKLFIITIISLLASAAVHAQADGLKTPAVEDLYLAKDNGSGKAGEPVSEFSSSDVPIYCVVLLDGPAKVTVKMNFVAVGVRGMKPETKVVTATYTTKEGQNRVNFTGRPETDWPPGRYRVDIFLDGKAAKTVEFDINAAGTSVGGNNTAKKFVPVEDPKRRRPAKAPRP